MCTNTWLFVTGVFHITPPSMRHKSICAKDVFVTSSGHEWNSWRYLYQNNLHCTTPSTRSKYLSVRVEKHGVIRRGLIDVVHTQYSLKKIITGTGYHKVGATCIENFMVTILRYAMWGVMLANL